MSAELSDALLPSAQVAGWTSAGSSTRTRRVTLAPFQNRAVLALAENVARVHAHIARGASGGRGEIARSLGTSLLAAPTGSGKTLVLGRTLETLVPDPVVPATGFRGSVWFWFAPYAGLVEQTRLALRAECPGLRLRDLARDREPGLTRDGDIFVQTWGSVAANNREARRLRRSVERALSVDDMIAALREDGFFIGCVIDEAHINFGTSARAAGAFYLHHLSPDATLLATATPRDDKLDAFLQAAEMGQPHRVEVSRADVIAANLNKRGLVAAYLVLTEAQRSALDPDETIVRAAWSHHETVKERLASHGVTLTPLLLVQVPNDTLGMNEVDRLRRILVDAGVPEQAIRAHTSGQPDPEFHALSNDEDVEVLIFKLAAATGFDAPRAFSLVSVRPVMTPEFGLQVIGRVMRVDHRVRSSATAVGDPLLSRGTVFLANPDRQGGLQSAADTLAAFQATIAPVTPQLTLVFAGDVETGMADRGDEVSEAGLQTRLLFAPGPGNRAVAGAAALAAPINALDYATILSEAVSRGAEQAGADDAIKLELFGADVLLAGSVTRAGERPGRFAYHRRRELGGPERLMREKSPDPARLAGLAEEAAQAFVIDDRIVSRLIEPITVDVQLVMRELLLGARAERSERIAALPSPAKLAEAAQLVFAFSEDVDPRLFRRRLVERFRAKLRERRARPVPDAELARVIDSIAVFEPWRIQDALRLAMAAQVEAVPGEPLPDLLYDDEGLYEARRALYGVFPSDLNGPERRFAEWLDETDGVRWWLRNPSHPANRWAVRLILANGSGFHPDFVVGVAGRRVLDGSRLRTTVRRGACTRTRTVAKSEPDTPPTSTSFSSPRTRRVPSSACVSQKT